MYRFLIFNSLMFALVAALAWNGILGPVYANDQSGLTIAITILFAVGWLWSLKETAVISLEINSSKFHGPEPACYAKRDKDVAKTEWLSSVSEWLVALGLLGTVIGFSIALSGIDQASVANATGAQGRGGFSHAGHAGGAQHHASRRGAGDLARGQHAHAEDRPHRVLVGPHRGLADGAEHD
jgi:hypothetical protein